MRVNPRSQAPDRELSASGCAVVRAVASHAAARPLDPCVFYQEGIDWHWIDWRSFDARVARAARRLAESGSLEGCEVGFPSTPSLETLVLDLALRHVGAVPRPGAGANPPAAAVAGAWIGVAGGPVPVGDPVVAGTELVGRWRRARDLEVEAVAAGFSAPPPQRTGPVAWLGHRAAREIVVEVLELERPLCRAGVSWTIERGAALVLAHERGSLEASARWARPTRLWAETAEARFDRLVAAVLSGRVGGGGVRRRGRRLVSALWSGEQEPSPQTLDALARGGVAVREWRAAADGASARER